MCALSLGLAVGPAGHAFASDWTKAEWPAGEFVRDITEDSQGDIWTSTLEQSGTFGHIEVLWKGASEWEDACAGLDWSYSSWDNGLECTGDRLFLATTTGECFARSLGDSEWHMVTADLSFFDLTYWDGYLWGGAAGSGVARLDSASEQSETVNDGLPLTGATLADAKSFWGPKGNDRYLYVGFRVANEVAANPDFQGVDVYRLARGGSTWEDTGLKVMVLGTDFRSNPANNGVLWGVWNLTVMNGYVMAEMTAPAGSLTSRLFLFDEQAGTWTSVSLPSWQPIWYYDTTEENCIAWDGKFYFPAGFGKDGALFDEFDPASEAWRQNVSLSGTTWAPLGVAAQALGDQLLIAGPATTGGGETTTTTAPSFVESVPLPTQISRDPGVIGTNFGLALLFAVVFGFTSTLFNNTLRSNRERLAKAVAPLGRGMKSLRSKAGPVLGRFGNRLRASTFRFAPVRAIAVHLPHVRRRWLEPLVIVLLAALIYAFLDPKFGFSRHGANIYFSLFISVAVVTWAYEGIQAVTSSRGYHIQAALKLFPAAIVIAVFCVILSRLTGFTPGYLYGFVGGLAFLGAGEPEERRRGRIVLVGAICLLVVSVGAWFLAIPVTKAADSGSWWAPAIQSICAATFVAGLEGLLFGLVPLTFMDGGALFRWSKVVWSGLFGVALFLFWHVLLNKSSKYGAAFEQTNTQVVLVILGFWTVVTVGTWLLFRTRRPKTPQVMAPGVQQPPGWRQPQPGAWGQPQPGAWGQPAQPQQTPPPPPASSPPPPPPPPSQW